MVELYKEKKTIFNMEYWKIHKIQSFLLKHAVAFYRKCNNNKVRTNSFFFVCFEIFKNNYTNTIWTMNFKIQWDKPGSYIVGCAYE